MFESAWKLLCKYCKVFECKHKTLYMVKSFKHLTPEVKILFWNMLMSQILMSRKHVKLLGESNLTFSYYTLQLIVLIYIAYINTFYALSLWIKISMYIMLSNCLFIADILKTLRLFQYIIIL